MIVVGTRPNLPVFVSSTFTDMQLYRHKALDALTQLEAIIRGMEHFGSLPGIPVEECRNVVRSCRLYVGIFWNEVWECARRIQQIDNSYRVR
jgi:hypothetical protein